MSSQNIFHDTRSLPTNVLTLVDDQFYEFVEQRLGMYQSLLLKMQEINSVQLIKICFPLEDGSFIVKPGVKNSFTCLRNLLSKKIDEKLKPTRTSKSPSTTAISTDSVTLASPSSISLTTTSLLQTINPPSPAVPVISIAEHRSYFLNLLKLWCSNHKDEFMSDSFDLKEGEDFILNVLNDQNNNLIVSVKCNCGRSISLNMKDGKIQLSNYQKHLRSTNCSHVKTMKKMNSEQNRINIQQSANVSSPSTSIGPMPPGSNQAESAQQAFSSDSSAVSPVLVTPSVETKGAALSEKNSLKRVRSSQSSLSKKTKRSRA
ncbi:unnamed protein product [Adineta ricciae]|uniref:Uncharacterized protein n=1 Tax=Adineta ricciae TaxID=249248 RepID=A0A815VQ15_ADIRI|nr:unnamed protein product [Adineta ricciae]CAF1531058.1 unnamed protein product [Adineta ricciae]